VAVVLAHQSAILLALEGTRAYIHSRDIALDHVVFVTGCAIVFGTTLYNDGLHCHLDDSAVFAAFPWQCAPDKLDKD